MAITVGATAYIAQQAYGQLGSAPRPQANTPDAQSGKTTAQTRAPAPQYDNTNKEKQLQEARKKDPAAEITSHPGYTFETDLQNHRIMKVSDGKGVLIYQVPSKGELALIEAQDSAKKRLALTA